MAAGQRWAGLGALGGNGIASVRRCCVYAGQLCIGAGGGRRPVDGTSGFCKHRCAVAAPLLGKHPFQKGTSYVCIWIWFKMFSFFFFFCKLRICRITKKKKNNNQKMHWSIQHRKKGKTHTHTARIIMQSKETQVAFSGACQMHTSVHSDLVRLREVQFIPHAPRRQPRWVDRANSECTGWSESKSNTRVQSTHLDILRIQPRGHQS